MHACPLSLLLAVTAMQQPGAAQVALSGLDPVALCDGERLDGSADLEQAWGLFHYRFASRGNKERFLADPERWCIQWDGGCARMGPLSGTGSPERYTVHAGRIYIFASDGCRDGFLADPERFLPASHEAPGATPAERAAGLRWIEKAVLAHGGAAALDGRAAMRWTAAGETSGWRFEQALTIASSGEIERRSRWVPPADDPDASASESVWFVGDGATCSLDGESHVITSPDAIVDLRRFAAREPVAHLWRRDAPDFEAVHRGPGLLGEREVVDVRVRWQGLETTLHLDPDSARILGLSWRGRPGDGVTRDVVEVFSAWESVDGVRTPRARRVLADGELLQSLGQPWTEIEVAPAPARPSRDL